MKYAVLVDFGSTYTKIVCVNLKERKVVATDKFPSTVHEDAAIGLNQCFEVAISAIGNENFETALKLATSSAAGGLRMAVVGLTNSISIEAGRNASFSAGAKVVCNTAGILSESDLLKIEESRAEILLLCGGHEGGNTHSLLKNAQILSESNLTIPIIYAGNSQIEQEVRRTFMITGKECFLAENIIPAVGSLNTEPTAEIIRELFMKRITNMKGVGFVQKEMNEMIVPTPSAVLAAGELLSLGTETQEGLGSIMMADIGGATTDIYSYMDNKSFTGAKRIGSPEPFAKRTVEGDLGMRESSISLINEIGKDNFAKKCGISKSKLDEAIEKRITKTEYIALGNEQKSIDYCIACGAISLSARRHAGTVSKEFNDGCRLVQRGKNLTGIKKVIGTGGIIVNESNAYEILKKIEIKPSEAERVLLPEKIDAFIDQDYVLFAAGLLRKYDEEAALTIMKTSLNMT